MKILWIIGIVITTLRLFLFFTEEPDYENNKASKQFLAIVVAYALLFDIHPFGKSKVLFVLSIIFTLLALRVNRNLYLQKKQEIAGKKEESEKPPS